MSPGTRNYHIDDRRGSSRALDDVELHLRRIDMFYLADDSVRLSKRGVSADGSKTFTSEAEQCSAMACRKLPPSRKDDRGKSSGKGGRVYPA